MKIDIRVYVWRKFTVQVSYGMYIEIKLSQLVLVITVTFNSFHDFNIAKKNKKKFFPSHEMSNKIRPFFLPFSISLLPEVTMEISSNIT